MPSLETLKDRIYVKDIIENSLYKEAISFDEINATVNEVLDVFNYEKVYQAMKMLNWHWASENGVPSEEAIKLQAECLIWESIAHTMINGLATLVKPSIDFIPYIVATGGLEATTYLYEDDEQPTNNEKRKIHLNVTLKFILEGMSSSTEYLENE